MRKLPVYLAVGFLLFNPGFAEARTSKNSAVGVFAEAISRKVEEVRTTAPGDLEVCFSPDESCDLKLIKFIRGAQVSIDVAIFDINLDSLVTELLEKSRKIPVRFVVDKRQAKGEYSAVPMLVNAGASVRFGRQKGIMHHKFVIVDGKMLELGSFNFTRSAAARNSENQLYVAQPKVVERYKQRFEKLWREGKPAGE